MLVASSTVRTSSEGLFYLKEERERKAGDECIITEEVIDEDGTVRLGIVVAETCIKRTW